LREFRIEKWGIQFGLFILFLGVLGVLEGSSKPSRVKNKEEKGV